MQHDAVITYHWMTGAQFLNAVALGQITPGPVVQTVAVVGYAAGGIGGGLLAALWPSHRLSSSSLSAAHNSTRSERTHRFQSFLTGAGPAVIGAIAGSAIPSGFPFGICGKSPYSPGCALALRRPARRRECLFLAGASASS